MTNAVVIPPVLRFNQTAIEDRITAAGAYLGIPNGFEGFFDFVLALRSELGVPDRLRELGVGDNRIVEMAKMAVEDPSAGGNPIELTREAAERLYRECI